MEGNVGIDVVMELVNLRREYKNLEQRLKTLKSFPLKSDTGRYVSLAYTELQSSRHWLGEALGAEGVK